MADNFGPVPGGSVILWQTDKMIIYEDSKGKIWRYLKSYDQRWPVTFDPPLKSAQPFKGVKIPPKIELTEKEIEDLI